MENPTERPGYTQVFTSRIKLRNGKFLYASERGHKCFVIWVKDKDVKSE